MNLRKTLIELAEQSGAKDLPACEQAVVAAASDQRSMVNALLDTGQVDEKVFAQKLGETLGLPVCRSPRGKASLCRFWVSTLLTT